MNQRSRGIIAVLLAGVWINASEFFRNEVLLKPYWIEHYKSLGMTFPSEPINGIFWMLWGFLYAVAIFFMSRTSSLLKTTLIGWLTGFVLMWIVIMNLGVLPLAILPFAVPLSLLEAFVGAYICIKTAPNE
ncbi:MAG TPA: hypothetical protein PLT09_12870 [Deltaproteobacteria bacterium]|nr:hypothetical protein [Deltaproteobacteria bacterium]HPR56143.1 hypothetical protein [Deltaproteobacteria bacterium]HXK48333.1 hypothetical protein [Deltaproteobacteria bacterium]